VTRNYQKALYYSTATGNGFCVLGATKRQHIEVEAVEEAERGPEPKRARPLADDDESEESTTGLRLAVPVAYTSDDERDSISFYISDLFDKTKKELEVERRSACPRRSAQTPAFAHSA